MGPRTGLYLHILALKSKLANIKLHVYLLFDLYHYLLLIKTRLGICNIFLFFSFLAIFSVIKF